MTSTTCLIEECTSAPRAKKGGYCSKHRTRILRHGSPDTVLQTGLPEGHERGNWVGSAASYGTAHNRTRRRRGPASSHQCSNCPAPAKHWAYDHRDANERVSETGLPYSTDPDHYTPLCVPCHKTLDLSLKGSKR